MIIWGSKNREKQIGEGQFYCPNCRTDTGYLHIRISRYFTLYFVPLFQTKELADYVQCLRCNGQFDLRVVELTPDEIEEKLNPWVCIACGNSNPTNYQHCIACSTQRL